MKTNNTKTLLALTLLAGGLASCSVEEHEIPAEEQYAREFYKNFGTNWSSEGFNVVEQKSVHVNSTKPAHVQIFELQGGEYRLAADYQNVTDQTITFDGVKGDNSPFMVRCDGAMLYAENGGTVNYKGQGTVNYKGQGAKILRSSAINPDQSSIVSLSSNYTTINCVSGDNTFEILSTKNGQNNVSSGAFTVPELQYLPVKGNSAFTIFPAYWNSKKAHTIGIYFYDEYGINTIPLYTDKAGDELQFQVNGNYTTTLENAEDCFDFGDAGKASYTNGFSFNAKGYTVKATHDVIAGLYVQIGEKYYFSDKDLNDDGVAYFAYKIMQGTDGNAGYTYYAFDDPSDEGGEGDRDFNDLVIYVGQEIKPTSLESMGWTVACEDLGGTFDFDFNDIVFQVYYVSGNDWISIIPLAAGGTLPAHLQILRNGDWYDISNEWHSHFGAKSDTYNSGQMINTCYGGADYERKVWPIKVKLSENSFSMSPYTTQLDQAGKFRLRVQRDKEWISINQPGEKENPQILVLPLDWRWPKELVRINSIYPTFGEWGSGYSDGATNNWVNNIQNADNLTEDKFYKHVTSRGKAHEPSTESED